MIGLAPSVEALQYGETVALFVGDRAVSLRGRDSAVVFRRLKKLFAAGLLERNEIEQHEPELAASIDKLLDLGVLEQQRELPRIVALGDQNFAGSLRTAVSEWKNWNERRLFISLPRDNVLEEQQGILALLRPGDGGLFGCYRGTSVFFLPVIDDPAADLAAMFQRLFSTEAGVANLYFLEELSRKFTSDVERPDLDAATAQWVAADLAQLIMKGQVDAKAARIYRGTCARRDDVDWRTPTGVVSAEDTIEETAFALQQLFVGRGLPIARLTEFSSEDNGSRLFAVNADVARSTPLFTLENEELDAWGTAPTRSFARLKAIMEGLERFSISSYCMNDYVLASPASLGGDVLDRARVAGIGPDDNAIDDIPSTEVRRWCRVENRTGHEKWVPLELVRYPVPVREAGYTPTDHVSSSGVGAHLTFDKALEGACYELIERDAFLIAWLRKCRPPLFDLSKLPKRLNDSVLGCQANGWTVRLMNLTADFAPVVCALISRSSDGYLHSFGAASADDIEAAALKALEEAQINFRFFDGTPRPAEVVLKSIRTPKDHMELYAGGANDDRLLRFFGSSERHDMRAVTRFEGRLLDRLTAGGFEVFTADLTHPSVLASGVSVVRAIVPGLVPMQFGKDWARTGSQRIWDVPERCGWTFDVDPGEELERFPHPFP